MAFYLNPPPRNPLAALFGAVVGAVVLVGAFFLGAIFLAVALSLGLLVWIVVAIRIKWLQRRFRKQGGVPPQQASLHRTEINTIEGEFTVVERRDAD